MNRVQRRRDTFLLTGFAIFLGYAVSIGYVSIGFPLVGYAILPLSVTLILVMIWYAAPDLVRLFRAPEG